MNIGVLKSIYIFFYTYKHFFFLNETGFLMLMEFILYIHFILFYFYISLLFSSIFLIFDISWKTEKGRSHNTAFSMWISHIAFMWRESEFYVVVKRVVYTENPFQMTIGSSLSLLPMLWKSYQKHSWMSLPFGIKLNVYRGLSITTLSEYKVWKTLV